MGHAIRRKEINMLGKAKCKILKEIRQKIADENDIPYVTRECTYQGDCSGTCPRCESELRYLERELEARRRIGKQVAITALCTGISLGATGCNAPGQLGGATEPDRPTYGDGPDVETVLEGEIADPGIIEELSGDVAEYPPDLAGAAEVWDDCNIDPASGDAIKTSETAFTGLTSFAGTVNKNAVISGARHCPVYTPAKDVKLCALTTHHWNGGLGAVPGVIRIYDITDGGQDLLGTWDATARDESDVSNANWDIFPDITLLAGHVYHIVDSDPATWSSNAESGDMGFVELFTDDEAETEGDFTPCSGH